MYRSSSGNRPTACSDKVMCRPLGHAGREVKDVPAGADAAMHAEGTTVAFEDGRYVVDFLAKRREA